MNIYNFIESEREIWLYDFTATSFRKGAPTSKATALVDKNGGNSFCNQKQREFFILLMALLKCCSLSAGGSGASAPGNINNELLP